MKINRKTIIFTLIILTIFCILGSVSANDSINENSTINDVKPNTDDSQNSLSDTTNTQHCNSNDDKQIMTNTHSQNKKSSENNGKQSETPDTIYVSSTGNDSHNGDFDNPVATIKQAINLTKKGSGKIIITEGTYHENDITIDGDNEISIIGEGHVVIDGTGLEEKSIFTIETKNVIIKNIIFTNNKATQGSAFNIVGESDTNPIDVDIIIDNCCFDNLETYKSGSAIYASYSKGNIDINNSNFTKSNANWASICVQKSADTGGLNLKINNSNFVNNYANNAGALYISQAANITITNSVFYNNTAKSRPGAMYLNNCSVLFDNCSICNNTASNNNPVILIIRRTVHNTNFDDESSTSDNLIIPTNVVITNCIIENNTAIGSKIPVIRLETSNLNISYSSIVNGFDIENTFMSGEDETGNLTANNNWWGTNDPFTKVNGTNVFIDNWVIMNVVPDASIINPGDEVKVNVDFNHVKTSSGEIEELTGGIIPKTYQVTLTTEKGTVNFEEFELVTGETKEVIYTNTELPDTLTVTSDEFVSNIKFKDNSEPYYGIIYVSKNGNDANDGSYDYPVASISKAIELAYLEGGLGQIIITEGTYTGHDYTITKNLTIIGQGNVVIDAECQGRLFYMPYGVDVDQFSLTNLTLTGANHDYGAIVYSFARELILENVNITNNPGAGDLITNYGNLTIKNSKIFNHEGGDVIESSGNGNIIISNSLFENNLVKSDFGIVYISSGKGNLIVENSQFINNTARQGILKGDINTNIEVRNSSFINNNNMVSYGGAIYAQSKLTVTNSTFINNHANRDGGAIYVGLNAIANIVKSSFINNSMGAGYHGDAIYTKGQLTVNYCVLLTNASDYLIYNSNLNKAVNAQYNWWGTNNNPENLVSGEHYEDEYEEEDSIVDASKWVILNTDIPDTVPNNHKTIFNIDFKHYNDSSIIKELEDTIPEIMFNVNAINGQLDKNEVITKNNIAKISYIGLVLGEDIIKFNNGAISKIINVVESQEDPIAIVTPDTIGNFFNDNNGVLELFSSCDELIFEGEFNDLVLIINNPVNLTGNGALFNNTKINIIANNVNVTNITFVANKDIESIIYTSSNNTLLENNNITYNALNTGDSYAICLFDANGLQIINNTINYIGTLGDNIHTIPIYAFNCANMTIKNNNVNATIPSVDIDYSNWPIKTDIFSSGIVLDTCGDITFEDNNVTVNYNEANGGSDTLYGVNINGNSNAKITGNNILVNGHYFTYGLGGFSGFENIEISNNNITANSQTYQANTLELYPNKGTLSINNNNITANAPDASYPIHISAFGEDDNLAVDATITNNNIEGYANTIYGIYSQEKSVVIDKNNITVNGNYTTGIMTHQTNATITNNNINANGTNTGTQSFHQNGAPENETVGICTSSSNNITISNNNITSTSNYTIDAINTNGTIKNNELKSAKGIGDATIAQTNSKVTVDNNSEDPQPTPKPTPTPAPVVKIIAKNVKQIYDSDYKVRITVDGKVVSSGKLVTFKIGKKTYTRKTDKNGYAKIKLDQKPGKYTITITYDKTKTNIKATIQQAIKAKNNIKVKKSAKRLNIKATLKKLNKKILTNKKLVLKLNGKTYKAKTNKKGQATFKILQKAIKKLKKGKKYTYTITYRNDVLKRKLIVRK